MIKQNIKLSIRNLLKYKIITGINILGLAIGITISLLIFAFIQKERSMDDHFPDIDNIFVLLERKDPSVSFKMVEHVRNEIPEIEHITYAHYEWSSQVLFKHQNRDYNIEKLLIADSSFFKVFSFEPVWGKPQQALNIANQVVITQTLAKKIFGDVNPVGQQLVYNATYLQNELLTVGAVIKDHPHHSSWSFESVMSVQTNHKINWYKNLLRSWGTQNYTAYFKTKDRINPALIAEKLTHISKENIPEKYKSKTQFSMTAFTSSYYDLSDIRHLKHGNKSSVLIIQVIGFFILLLACVNYINLITAQRLKRIKNIGILKTLGSGKRKIIELFITESALILVITVFVVMLLSDLLLIKLNSLTNSQFTLSSLYSGWNLCIFLSIIASTFILTGIIPGYVFSQYQTTLLLKNSIKTNTKNHLRNGLLVFQFTISITLLASLLFINRQNRFLSTKHTGFNRQNIIYTTTNDQIQTHIEVFKDELKKIPEISNVTYSSGLLGFNDQNWSSTIKCQGKEQEIGFANLYVAPNFFDFFEIELIKGRQFTKQSDKTKDIIFNESTIKTFHINQPEKAQVMIGKENQGHIIGIIKDFNFESMHVPIRPIGFLSSGEVDEVVYFKIHASNAQNYHASLQKLERIWSQISPDFPLEIKSLDVSWANLYKKDQQFQQILSYATIISLLLSSLGLISLTHFITEMKTKEIGIRKTNGAKTAEIVILLNRHLVKWILIAFIIACPLCWYTMTKWLENFAYKAPLSWWIFALAALVTLLTAFVTLSWQTWKAAAQNPVKCLRYE